MQRAARRCSQPFRARSARSQRRRAWRSEWKHGSLEGRKINVDVGGRSFGNCAGGQIEGVAGDVIAFGQDEHLAIFPLSAIVLQELEHGAAGSLLAVRVDN